MTNWSSEYVSTVMFLDDLENFSKAYVSLMLIARDQSYECKGEEYAWARKDLVDILTKMSVRINGVIDGLK